VGIIFFPPKVYKLGSFLIGFFSFGISGFLILKKNFLSKAYQLNLPILA
jgi:hypothetical protein